MTARLVPLSIIFPRTHRSTLYRWRKTGKVGEPDFVANGREFYSEDRFAAREGEAAPAKPQGREKPAKVVA